jgi:hypothetical protein
MTKQSISILFSYVLLIGIVAVSLVDVLGTFLYKDWIILVVIFLYLLFTRIQRSTSRLSFSICIFYLLWMGLQYIPTGASSETERIGVWFYIFLFISIIGYGRESFKGASQ